VGKITSIYLTDEEAAMLEKFCNENQCTQYSALKTALRELVSQPIKTIEEDMSIDQESETMMPSDEIEESETNKPTEQSKPSLISRLIRRLSEK